MQNSLLGSWVLAISGSGAKKRMSSGNLGKRNRRAGSSPSPEEAFLMLEFESIKDQRLALNTRAISELTLYFGSITIGSVVLGFYAARAGIDILSSVPFLTIAFLSTLVTVLIGLIIWVRLVKFRVQGAIYIRGLNLIRKYFVQKYPVLMPYMVMPFWDLPMSPLYPSDKQWSDSGFQPSVPNRDVPKFRLSHLWPLTDATNRELYRADSSLVIIVNGAFASSLFLIGIRLFQIYLRRITHFDPYWIKFHSKAAAYELHVSLYTLFCICAFLAIWIVVSWYSFVLRDHMFDSLSRTHYSFYDLQDPAKPASIYGKPQ
ncbi:MAG: hypothetical protein WBA46_14250 [Thermomicrobiales bacterium]